MLRNRLASILALTAGSAFLATACSGASDSATEERDDEHTGTAAQHWETKGTTGEHSTHVWIVERAIDLLATKNAEEANGIRAILNDATCDPRWRQGLNDADYLHQYNDGLTDLWVGAGVLDVAASGASWKSHFYDPDTGMNYEGETSPTARTQASAFVSQAVSHLQAGDEWDGCYELGLALHYMTDVTQPMHVVNYTNLSFPLQRHGNYENYAEDHQASVGTAPAIFTLLGLTPDQVLVDVAHESKGYWSALSSALDGGDAGCLILEQATWYSTGAVVDFQCWAGSSAIDTQMGNNLRAAQVATARYLYAVGHLLTPSPPAPQPLPSDFKATMQNASRNGATNECLIFGGNGQNTYPERYLWGGGDNGDCGFGSKADLLANKQAVWTFHNLGGDLYTIRNASRDGSTSECLIFSGSGQNTYPERYLWGGHVDNEWCGFGSKADLLANKQAVWRVTPLAGNQYSIANASADGTTDQCLIFSGSGQNTYPSRYLWSGGDNGACGLSSVNDEIFNKQSAFTITVMDACPANQTPYGEWAGGFCCDGTVGAGGGSCEGTACALDPTRPQGLVLCPSVMPECRSGTSRYGEWAGGFCCDGAVGPGGGSCAGTICALDPARTQGLPLCPVCPPLQTLYGEWAGAFCCDGALTPGEGSCVGTVCALDPTRPQGLVLCPSVMPACPSGQTRYGESVGGFCCDGTVDGSGSMCDGSICALDSTRTQGYPLCD
jgi:phospholipase C